MKFKLKSFFEELFVRVRDIQWPSIISENQMAHDNFPSLGCADLALNPAMVNHHNVVGGSPEDTAVARTDKSNITSSNRIRLLGVGTEEAGAACYSYCV